MEPFRLVTNCLHAGGGVPCRRNQTEDKGMPPFVVVALGALGAAVLAKVIASESRRVNDALSRQKAARNAETAVPLERDPLTGAYRPRRN